MSTCRACGCTDLRACPGGCTWADAACTICSRCHALGGDVEQCKVIEFGVDREPAVQPRARHGGVGTTKTGKMFARVYNPGTPAAWKSAVQTAVISHRPKQPWAGPVFCHLTLFLPRPERLKKPGSQRGLIFAGDEGVGDNDNFEKAIWDCLTAPRKKKRESRQPSSLYAVWVNDCQIVMNETRKFYESFEPLITPGAVVRLCQLSSGSMVLESM